MDRANLRAGDADRQRVADALQRHYVEGRLTQDELTERVRKANSARTFGELDGLLQDLPPLPDAATEATAPTAPVASPPPPTYDVTPAGAGLFGQQDVRMHVTSYALVMVLLVAIWLITTPGGYFWPIWPMLGWGIAVVAHALARRTS